MQEIVLDEVYGVRYTSFWNTFYGYMLIAAVILFTALIIAGAIFAVLRYRRESTAERTIRNLKRLAERLERGALDNRKIYQELTRLIKNYSQWQFQLPRGITDYELTTMLCQISSLEEERRAPIERIISDAQAVKFGGIDLLKRQVQRDIADSIMFVKSTDVKHKGCSIEL
jgi:hypothetical protein